MAQCLLFFPGFTVLLIVFKPHAFENVAFRTEFVMAVANGSLVLVTRSIFLDRV